MAKNSPDNAAPPDRTVEPFFLEELQFDLRNPRYGTSATHIHSERDALDHVVRVFGVSDVLSSIAVNGYFDSEPLIGLRNDKKSPVTIMEGNRRLAACLILAGDERAANQARLREQYSAIREKHGNRNISPVPVILYEGAEALTKILPFIGVRHIVGFLEWDSYAKAAWVDKILREQKLKLDDVVEMLGDKNRTIPRMLGGYRMVKQLVESGHFRPDQSLRKGRGSNPEFPFSWVYTVLDSPPAKEFVGFQENDGEPAENPIPESKLAAGGELMTFMFGDNSRGVPPAVDDSRELGDLARTLREPSLRNSLREGKKLRFVLEEAKPSADRLREGFESITGQLQTLASLVVPGNLDSDAAMALIKPALTLRNLAKKIHADLLSVAHGSADDEE